MSIRTVQPVPLTLALQFAGGASFKRKVLVHQARITETIALMDGDTPIVLVMFMRLRPRRWELALAFGPGAGSRSRLMMRFAQLTLRRIAETGILVFTRIAPANRQACRLAMLTGFVPGGFRDPAIWLWKDRQ